MNPLHRTTAGARTSEDLVPEAHGYGYIASSEAAPAAPSQTVPEAHGYGYVVVSDDDDPASAPAAEAVQPADSAEPARTVAPARQVQHSPLVEFITDSPAAAAPAEVSETVVPEAVVSDARDDEAAHPAESTESAEPAESAPVRAVAAEPISVAPAVVLSPLLPNIGTSTMARLLDLTEVPVAGEVPASTARVVVIDATEKGVAAAQAYIEVLKARGPEPVGSVTSLDGLDGILVIPADSRRIPRTVKLRLKVLSGACPVLMCPWIPALASRICDDAALEKAAAARPVAAALKKLAAQVEGLAG
ncbi:MAG: hypothetical protein HXO58_09230 [Rothia mucilaginosa]|uniref:Uncharacterized protein n=1 Tax=Rothia mucilaginosa TaxID=43675 RepID=A0A930KZP6_9MICC|nr:hypothetical protein [Rothia mucilaginosa]MBF1659993.1 hypothetical protein [Rothia mucilaginosa]